MPCTEENIKKYVRLTKLKNTPENPNLKDAKEVGVKESYEIELQEGFDKVKFINEGYVSKQVMEKHIRESSSINDIDERVLRLLENKFPNSSIISTDEKVFIIKGNKILMLG